MKRVVLGVIALSVLVPGIAGWVFHRRTWGRRGVRAPIKGERAPGWIIIDDPFKSPEQIGSVDWNARYPWDDA